MFSIWKIVLTIVATSAMLAIFLVIYRFLDIDTDPLWLIGVVGAVLVGVLGVTHGQAIIARVKSETGEIKFATRPSRDFGPDAQRKSSKTAARDELVVSRRKSFKDRDHGVPPTAINPPEQARQSHSHERESKRGIRG